MTMPAADGRRPALTEGAIRAWCGRIRFSRWAHFLVLPLATFDPNAPRSGAVVAALRGSATAFAILAFGYLLNSIADRRMDLDAHKNPFITSGTDDSRYSVAGLIVLSLGLALLGPWPAQLATVACLTFGCIYSMGPRIKAIPVVGSIANLGNFGPLLFVGMRDTSLPPRFWCVALAFAALLLQNQLIHEAADALEDRGGGVRTTWLALGPRWTALMAAALGIGATVAAACIVPAGQWPIATLIVGIIYVTAFPLLLARRGVEPAHAAQLRMAHRWCALLFGAGLFTAWHRGA
jgi:4-hydroxybenzoate polyprenyltransferase